MWLWCLDDVQSREQVFGVRNGGFGKISDVFSSEHSRLPEGVLWFPHFLPL